MNLEFLPEARIELIEAVEFYENKQSGLGKRFKNEIIEACSTILAHPCFGANGRADSEE
jgi:hypothetical protein